MSRLKTYMTIESMSGMLLFFGALLALCLSNSFLYEEYLSIIHLPISLTIGDLTIGKSLIKWVNDGLMALFFLVLMLEVKFHLLEGTLEKGHLKLAICAALGGVIFPALVYYGFTYSDVQFSKGWAIPAATDTAFVLGIVSFFHPKIPLSVRLFIIWISIIDDVIAVNILAIFYTPTLNVAPLFLTCIFLIVLVVLNLLNTRSLWLYIIVGLGLWFSIIEAGVHGTIAGVLVALFIPVKVESDDHRFHSPLKKMEHYLHPFVALFVLPLFAFLNSEVAFKEVHFQDLFSPITLGIVLGLFFGKQIGICLLSYIFLKFNRMRLPYGLSWHTYYAISVLCGIGFTFSLFIGLLSFDSTLLENQMKLGVFIGSFLSAIFGIGLLYFAPSYSSTSE